MSAFSEAFGTTLESAFEVLIREGWSGRNAQEPKSDLGWFRDEKSTPEQAKEQSPEHSHEPIRDLNRGIDR